MEMCYTKCTTYEIGNFKDEDCVQSPKKFKKKKTIDLSDMKYFSQWHRNIWRNSKNIINDIFETR